MSMCKDWVLMETKNVQTLISTKLKKSAKGLDTAILDLVIKDKIEQIKRASA